MKLTELYPSKYMKAEDFEDGETMLVTIDHIEIEQLGKKQEDKPVLYLRDNVKPLVLNKTNASIIGNLYGDETDNWTGKQITLYTMEVDSFGDVVRAIRVKTVAPKQKQQPPKPEPEPEQHLEWLEEIDQAPEAQPAKTLNLPEDHKFDKAKSNGKRTINFGKSTLFPTLMTWAQKQGYFEVGDKTIVPRLTNVLLGAGIEKFEDGAFETYKQIVAAHYAAKGETNEA